MASVTDKLVAKIKRGEDLELHVKLTSVEDDVEVRVNVREYIPSRDKYGRGLFVRPGDELNSLISALTDAKKAAK